jgi:ubiquinone/menaquinone biosynthesis C-methylase UbiE
MKNKTLNGVVDYYNKTTNAWIKTFKAKRVESFRWDADIEVHDSINADLMGLKDGLNILDAGCGVGEPMISYAKKYKNAFFTGVNITQYQLNKIKKIPNNIKLILGDYHKLKFRNNTFDLIYFIESFSHSYDKTRLLKEIYRLLKPGGRVYIFDHILTMNNLDKLHIHHDLCFHYPEHINEFKNLFNKANFKNIFFYDNLKDEKNKIIDKNIDPDRFYCYYKNSEKLTHFGKYHSVLVKENAYIMKPVACLYEK